VRSPTAQAEERPVLNVGLFINTQFPGGFNLAARIPELVAQRVKPDSRPCGSASPADPSDADGCRLCLSWATSRRRCGRV